MKALSKVFRGKFRGGLRQLYAEGKLGFQGHLQPRALPGSFERLIQPACGKSWVAYAKRPFAGPEAVLAYLARYTHRVGITNQRLVAVDSQAQAVTFTYKDFADNSPNCLLFR